MTERKLATIRVVKDILPIDGADFIELILIDGWQCVAQKGTYAKGGLAIYFEIDSFLNEQDPRFAALARSPGDIINWDGKRGMRIKTIRLRKQLSQGMLLPLGLFPEIEGASEGDDVTELLKIEKWESAGESAYNGGGRANGARPFPSFIHKTDQERVQNNGAKLKYLHGRNGYTFEITKKLDGSSMTAFVVQKNSPYYKMALNGSRKKPKTFLQRVWRKVTDFFTEGYPIMGLCSRNIWMGVEGNTTFHQIFTDYSLESTLKGLGGSYAIQGELIAPSIQENHEKVAEPQFHVFDVFNIDQQKYLLPQERRDFCKRNSLPHVPVVDTAFSLNLLTKDPEDIISCLLEKAQGDSLNPGVISEGMVYKCNQEDLSFKAISNKYLLKKEESADKKAKEKKALESAVEVPQV